MEAKTFTLRTDKTRFLMAKIRSGSCLLKVFAVGEMGGMKKIAVVGSTGFLGKYIVGMMKERGGYVILDVARHKDADLWLELDRVEEFDGYDKIANCEFVLFLAAVSSPDACSVDADYCWGINVNATTFFIRKIINQGCKVLFFSSDAVFGSGTGGDVFWEDSATKPITQYGKMKKTVEDLFSGDAKFKAMRLPYVVSANDKFIRYCLECMGNGRTAEIYHPFYRNCVTITDVGNAVLWMIDHWEKLHSPFMNLAGDELVSRIRIADEINRTLQDKLHYRIVDAPDGFFRNRPKIVEMKSLYIKKYKILGDKSFSERIKHELSRLEKVGWQ